MYIPVHLLTIIYFWVHDAFHSSRNKFNQRTSKEVSIMKTHVFRLPTNCVCIPTLWKLYTWCIMMQDTTFECGIRHGIGEMHMSTMHLLPQNPYRKVCGHAGCNGTMGTYINAYMYIYIYICGTCSYFHAFMAICSWEVWKPTCICLGSITHMYIYIYTYDSHTMKTHTCIYIYIPMFVDPWLYKLHISYICIYTWSHTHIQTLIHAHTHRWLTMTCVCMWKAPWRSALD